ncbi:hypothetical protein ACQP2T_35380 [Nonomuraea sp. CA-143628]|uniref:hypothetical protein n=1 Tax=Nonomuraea sp. CA-143628 TaxID=3239997 RepID=UPI003D92EC5D
MILCELSQRARAACPCLQREAHVYTSADYLPWGVKGLVFSASGRPTLQDVPLTDLCTLEFTLARALIVHVSNLRPAPDRHWPGSSWPLS